MSNAVKQAIEKYNSIKDKDYFISPISENDTKIVDLLVNILKKRGVLDVFRLMKDYKKVSDTDIIDSLSSVNVAKKAQVGVDEEGDEEELPPLWIQFNDTNKFKTYATNIISFQEGDGIVDDEQVYYILINEVGERASTVPIISNKHLCYYDIEQRDLDLEKLREITDY